MPGRQRRRAVPKQQAFTAELRRALLKRSKAELVELLLELARADRAVLRQLNARFEVSGTAKELVATTRQAIADATEFDERDINQNFDYDYEAYSEVKETSRGWSMQESCS